MGFNLSAFGAGFATAATEDIKKKRENAEVMGVNAVNNMNANYKNVMAENKKKEDELVKNINLLSAYDRTATQDELYAVATKAPVMNAITDLIKKDAFDPGSFKLSNFAKVASSNVTSTALERVSALSELPKLAKSVIEEQTASSGNFLRDFLNKGTSSAKQQAMLQRAQELGIPLERLQAAQGFTRPDASTPADIDMAKLAAIVPKSFASQEDSAKAAALKANASGDPEAIRLANASLTSIKDIRDNMSGEQTTFANKVAGLKNDAAFGTPEKKAAAEKELAKVWANERREAEAKRARGDGTEGKIPSLATLNSFASTAAGRAVAARFGDQVKSSQLAIVENPAGGSTITYIGTDATMRRQIYEVSKQAARDALSLYTDGKGMPGNRDVASVLNSFDSMERLASDVSNSAAPPPPPPALPKPAAVAAKPVVVNTPNGSFTFPSQAEADIFKKKAGIN
jgi:ferritin